MSIIAFLNEAIMELKDIDEDELLPALTFEQLQLDSLDYVEIQLRVQKRYKVRIDPELIESGKLATLGDLYAYIEDHFVTDSEALAA